MVQTIFSQVKAFVHCIANKWKENKNFANTIQDQNNVPGAFARYKWQRMSSKQILTILITRLDKTYCKPT